MTMETEWISTRVVVTSRGTQACRPFITCFPSHERSQLIFFDTAWNEHWQPVSNVFCSVSTRQHMDQEVCFLLSSFPYHI